MANHPEMVGRDRRARRTVFLTGASAGIGLETARLLAERGSEVWGTSRDPKRLPGFPGFHPVPMDLMQIDSVRNGFAAALKEAGAFDVLINNAGAGAFGPLEAISREIVQEQFQVLVEAPAELIRLVLPQMRERSGGTILNVTSLAAVLPVPFMAPYSAAKAALSVLTQGLRVELANTPIRVVEIRPGDINTAFHDATKKVNAAANTEDERRMRAAWETQRHNMAAAPPAVAVAKAILRVMENPRPPARVTVGGFFQARVAPLAARLLPPRLLEFGLRRYYRL
ncbi:MAG TPA: SDR family NAD(P)-dependent oxidoreductase [Verrucomicrobiae bacterium]|nr:SDR family NAD(P)-dependent oxidoreductase [Verrucomicrobiae bacterium]